MKTQPKLIGPPKTASNDYTYKRLAGNCIECACCGEMWHYKAKFESGKAIQVNIGGRVMAVKRAMWMAAYPKRKIAKGDAITTKCKNPNCINPKLIYRAKPTEVLKSCYEKGVRSKAQAVAHLMKYTILNQRISEEAVAMIRNDDRKGAEAAKEWGISTSHYNAIQLGKARVPMARNPFSGLGARV